MNLRGKRGTSADHRNVVARAPGRGGSNGRQATSAGSKGGVAHLEVSSDGRKYRDAQAAEGGVGINLRGTTGADGRAVKGAHAADSKCGKQR
eukprot:scaffold14089_cov79-Isochrysis_galbana.AAC.1